MGRPTLSSPSLHLPSRHSWLGSGGAGTFPPIFIGACILRDSPQRGVGSALHSVDPESWGPGCWATGSYPTLSSQ